MQFVFDLDGTLIDSSDGILGTLRHTFAVMGFPLLPDMEKFIGPPLEWAFQAFAGVDEQTAIEATKVYRKEYAVTGVLGVQVYDGIPEMLAKLVEDGHILHVATSKPEPFALRIFENIGLKKYFTHICGAGLDGSRATKSAVLAELFHRCGINTPNAETLSDWRMVGDRIYDVEGAAAFGLGTIAVTWGFGKSEEFAKAVAVVHTPMELVDEVQHG